MLFKQKGKLYKGRDLYWTVYKSTFTYYIELFADYYVCYIIQTKNVDYTLAAVVLSVIEGLFK